VRKMCWNQGDWRFYSHYQKWQIRAYDTALEIIQRVDIDIVHQLNMIGFREPGYLWRIPEIPFVWGPVDAKDKLPVKYLKGAGIKQQLFFRLKNTITCLQLKYSKRVRKAANRASFVVSASSNSQKSLKKYFGIDSPLINETGCYVKSQITKPDKENEELFHVLWTGKMDFRKQLDLALHSIAAAKIENLVFHIVGGGDPTPYRKLATSLGIDSQCVWHGVVSHTAVQELMSSCQLFFFTSIAEGTPHVVLEAIGNCLPVLCFDTCGQGDAIDSTVGIKIHLSNPNQSVGEFAEILRQLESNRSRVQELSQNCVQRQVELSWEKKVQTLLALYKNCLSPKEANKLAEV
jgi:glycosyltransferase involved in cell wall biosynthesis